MLCKLIVDGVQHWQGYIVSEQFSRYHLPSPYSLRLKATDGIALLKDIPYPGGGNTIYFGSYKNMPGLNW